jgi:hypothetical protein
MTATYQEFLAAKTQLATVTGLDIDPAEVHPVLKPHQRDVVVWAVRGGRRAVFASFGLGKTLIQLEAIRLTLAKLGGGRGLIVAPLGVRQEFIRDAHLLDLNIQFIRTASEASTDGIYITNYESIRDGKLDPRGFQVVSLDEAAILRGFGGTKTFRELMRLYEGTAHYRFVATATPSPNEYIELLAYAAFLDVMDIGQAKTRFFKRDSTKADRLTLLPHMEREFWLWVASWAMFLQSPADLGHDDTGYVLPPLEVRWHEVPSTTPAADEFDQSGRGALFRDASPPGSPRCGRSSPPTPMTTSCSGTTWRTSGARSRPRSPTPSRCGAPRTSTNANSASPTFPMAASSTSPPSPSSPDPDATSNATATGRSSSGSDSSSPTSSRPSTASTGSSRTSRSAST